MQSILKEAPNHGEQQLQLWNPLTQQQLFKGLMRAFSYPGQILRPSSTEPLLSVLATLVDKGVSVADPDHLLDALFVQRLECHLSAPESAAYVVCSGNKAPSFIPSLGSLESPETGATLLITVTSLEHGKRYRLRGPGIADTKTIEIAGLDPAWIKAHQGWRMHYPMGVDFILISQDGLIAMPRTLTLMEESH